MFTTRGEGPETEILLDGEPVRLAGTLEELQELAASVLQYVDYLAAGGQASARSGKWLKVRNEFVEENPSCAACGSGKLLNVHHIVPFHERPELELDKGNLICLCYGCHFTFGHLKSWSSHNPDVVRDAGWYLDKMRNRPS